MGGLALAGTGVAVALVLANDVEAIGAAFARIGWLGLAAIVAVRAGILALSGLGWAALVRGGRAAAGGDPAPPPRVFVLLRWIREALNVLLPVGSVGGDLVGARLLTFRGVGGGPAVAGVLVDLLIQTATQVLFAVAGVVLLLRLGGEAAISAAEWCAGVLGLGVLALAGFFAAQRLGLAGAIERGLGRVLARLGGDAAGSEDALGGIQAGLDALWARDRWRALLLAALLHLLAWFLGAAEIAVALACLDYPVGFAEIVVLESLTQALRAAAFPVPSGLGVQEGAYVVLGALFGIDAGTAVALSLVKRVPDVVLGLPGLLAWQAIEARRLASRRPAERRAAGA